MENTSPATSHYNAREAESSLFAENLAQVQLNFPECNVYTGTQQRMAFGTIQVLDGNEIATSGP